MRIITCDRCGKIIDKNERVELVTVHNEKDNNTMDFEFCAECLFDVLSAIEQEGVKRIHS